MYTLRSESAAERLPWATEAGETAGDTRTPIRLPVGSSVNRRLLFTGPDQSADGQRVTGEWTAWSREVRRYAVGHRSDHHRDITAISRRWFYRFLYTCPYRLVDPWPEFGGHMVSAKREPITGAWSGGQGTPGAECLFARSQPEDSANLS